MAGFRATLINEIEKLYKKKKALVAVIISLIFIVIGQISIIGVRNNFGLRGTSSTEFPILILSLVVNSILPLFTALVTIDSFSGEFSSNTMKISLTRPISRFKFLIAKLTAISIFVLSNLLLVMIFSVTAGLIFNVNFFNFAGLLKILLAYIVTLLPMMILAIFIALFSTLLRSGIAVFFLTILIFIIFKVLGVVFMQYSSLFFTSMFNWYSLWIMDTVPVLKIFRQFILMLSCGIILFTITYYLFDKKEF